MQNLPKNNGGKNELKALDLTIQAVTELCLPEQSPDELIERLSQVWPTNLEVPVLKMREVVIEVLSHLGWGDGVGERRWYAWVDLLSPIVPTDRSTGELMLDGTAYRELLYQGFYRHRHKRNSGNRYKANRLKRLGV